MNVLPFLALQVVIFIGLVTVLRKILSRNVTEAAAHLQRLSAEYARRHEELKQQSQESERQYQERLAKATQEAEQLVTQARQDAEASKVRLLEEARAESERIVQQALESSHGLQKEAEQTLSRLALNYACKLVQQVLPGQLRQEIQSRWLDELIRNGFAQLSGLNMAEPVQDAKVTSAFPLNDGQREILRKRLKEKLGHEIRLSESIDERLMAGLTVMLGSLVLDGSLASKLREAARQIAPDQ